MHVLTIPFSNSFGNEYEKETRMYITEFCSYQMHHSGLASYENVMQLPIKDKDEAVHVSYFS